MRRSRSCLIVWNRRGLSSETGPRRCTCSEAAVNRDELIGRRLRAVADSLCGGSLSPLLSHLVDDRGLSDAERRELRGLIEKLDRKRRSR